MGLVLGVKAARAVWTAGHRPATDSGRHRAAAGRRQAGRQAGDRQATVRLEKMGDMPLPESLICSLTQDVFVDPVLASDGHTYTRKAIQEWLRRNPRNPRSPKTNESLHSTELLPNITVRQTIEELREQQPMAIDPDRLMLSQPEELLGEGSFGRVVGGRLALGRSREVQVAVKKLPAMTIRDERAAFQKELTAFMHAARHCDGICVLYGTCELDSRVCMVMKRYVKSLHAVIVEEGKLEESEVRRYAHSLFRTLGQLHDSGLVVRDIKPDNILVDSYGDLVLSDFGISEIMQTATHVAQSQIKGTFAYMAPEAFDDAAVGPPLDVWGMSCVILEMHTGTAPWRGMKMQQIFKAVCVDRRAPEVPADAPAPDVLQRCFAFAPRDRPKATEVAHAFAPTFEPPPAQPVVVQLEQRCEELQAQNDQLVQENGALKKQLQAQQEVTKQITDALTAKSLEVERQAARILALEEEMRAAAEAASQCSSAQVVHVQPLLPNGLFDMLALSTKLSKPGGVHDVLAEVHHQVQVACGQAAEDLMQLHHCLGRQLPILKKPPTGMRSTLLQLASQEPAGSRVLREAQHAVQSAQDLQFNLIEWTNKSRHALPCVMEICEHSEAIYAVAVSPDGKLIASGSGDNTVVLVEACTGRVRQILRGHR